MVKIEGELIYIIVKLTMSIPIRHGQPWSSDEIQQLLQGVKKKSTIEQMASSHERTKGSIKAKLKNLAADYYFNDNLGIDEIIKYTGLDNESISDAISKRQYEMDMKEKKEKAKSLIQTTLVKVSESNQETPISLLKEIRDIMKEMIELLRKDCRP